VNLRRVVILALLTLCTSAATAQQIIGTLSLQDSDRSHVLNIVAGSDLSAHRTLTIFTGDADRTLTLNGNATLSGTNTGDQTLASLLPSYTGNALKILRVNSGGTDVEWSAAGSGDVSTSGSYANPAWITSLAASKITGDFGSLTFTSGITGRPSSSGQTAISLRSHGGSAPSRLSLSYGGGTFASPTAVGTGTTLGELRFSGSANTSSDQYWIGAALRAVTTQSWTTTTLGTKVEVQVVGNGNATLNTVAQFTSTGLNSTVIGATSPAAGTFTTASATNGVFGTVSTTDLNVTGALSASSTVSGTGFTNLFASPPAIGATTPSTGAFTTLSAGALSVGASGFQIAETNAGYSSAYRVLRIGTVASQRALALNVDPASVTGSSFTGAGQIFIPNASILAPNAAGTDWMGVLRAHNGTVIVGPALSSGEVFGPLTVTSTAVKVGVPVSTPELGEKLNVGGYAVISGNVPYLNFYTSGGGTNQKWFRVGYTNAAEFAFEAVNDAYTTPTTVAAFSSAGALRLHAYGAGTLTTDSSGNVTATSDARAKTVVGDFTTGLAAVRQLQPKKYHWRAETGLNTDDVNVSLIAQDLIAAGVPEAVASERTVEVLEEVEIEELLPVDRGNSLVQTVRYVKRKELRPKLDANGKRVTRKEPASYTVSDRAVISVLVNSIKELDAANAELRARLDKLETERTKRAAFWTAVRSRLLAAL
jgi:hypothetical protein